MRTDRANGDAFEPRYSISVALVDGRALLAANTYSLDTARTSNERIGVHLEGDGSQGLPRGGGSFAFPILLTADDGDVHMLWAEPEEGSPIETIRDLVQGRVSAVWTSRLSRSTGWSAPEQIVRSTRLVWNPRAVHATFDTSGRPVVGVITEFGTPVEALTVMTLRDRAWETRRWPTAVTAISATAWRTEGIGAAVIGSGARAPGANRVMLLKLGPAGAPGEIRVIDNPAERLAQNLRSVPSTRGVRELLWIVGGPSDSSLIRQATLLASGKLTAASDLQIPARLIAIHAASDVCGTVHVVYELPEQRALEYVQWHGGWGSPVRLLRDVTISAADITISKDGTLLVAAAGRPADASNPTALPLRRSIARSTVGGVNGG